MFIFIDETISQAFTVNGWLNVTAGGFTTWSFLHWSDMNERREYGPFVSVACKLMICRWTPYS